MWLSSSSVGRKFVMALTGAALVLFVTFHCLMNAVAICWPAAYNSICEFLGANWYALIASVGLAALLIIHIIYAVMLTLQNRKARGNDRYLISKTPKGVEWSSQNMLVLGIVILAFLVVHMIQFWAKMQLQEIRGVHDVLPPAAGTLFIQEAFSQVYTPIVYIIGFVALWFHFNHGFWSMFQSCGWDNQIWIERLKKIACWWATIVVACFIAQAIVFTVNAHRDYYKTNEVLRQQYKEMIIPMFEKDFGPDAANAISAAPFDQMKQMVKGTLSQMESPEAKAYFQNEPGLDGKIETLRAAAALIDYLDVETESEELPAVAPSNPGADNHNHN
ncbi:MAG: succinate dehydrogenase cytochrome b subunit [Muribaculaceae bacterium]|nr:succinate dehydrogenase cytochrome b subunit [Muribaculaceae bacterium]MDE6009810.1 succinate dehydrogenase cytochrome b subunit [Muribaculaceae bacterium]MDE6791730.1 succinate dehydrogenase cytochrome b subunit [Muribaculaceae bacterium]